MTNGGGCVGFDVDYCRALSTAVSSGDPTRVLFVEVVSSHATCAENADVESAECTGLVLCVKGSTTYFDVLSKLLFNAEALTANGLVSGECNVTAT
jgi:hypothetical protein